MTHNRNGGFAAVVTTEKRWAMGIDWMNRDELSEAIPPAYTHFVGEQLLAHLLRGAVS